MVFKDESLSSKKMVLVVPVVAVLTVLVMSIVLGDVASLLKPGSWLFLVLVVSVFGSLTAVRQLWGSAAGTHTLTGSNLAVEGFLGMKKLEVPLAEVLEARPVLRERLSGEASKGVYKLYRNRNNIVEVKLSRKLKLSEIRGRSWFIYLSYWLWLKAFSPSSSDRIWISADDRDGLVDAINKAIKKSKESK